MVYIFSENIERILDRISNGEVWNSGNRKFGESRFKVGRESYVKLYDETFASERKREREGLPGFIEERLTVLVCVGFYFRVWWVVNKASSTLSYFAVLPEGLHVLRVGHRHFDRRWHVGDILFLLHAYVLLTRPCRHLRYGNLHVFWLAALLSSKSGQTHPSDHSTKLQKLVKYQLRILVICWKPISVSPFHHLNFLLSWLIWDYSK